MSNVLQARLLMLQRSAHEAIFCAQTRSVSVDTQLDQSFLIMRIHCRCFSPAIAPRYSRYRRRKNSDLMKSP